MSQVLTVNISQSTKELFQSDSSSDLSLKNNKERMMEFNNLCLKRNTVMDHLLSCRTHNVDSKKTSVMFHSQKWDLAPVLQINDKDELTRSVKLNHDNPFFRAKQNLYNKQKVLAKSGQHKKYIDQTLEDQAQNNGRITFRRLLKKNSANYV